MESTPPDTQLIKNIVKDYADYSLRMGMQYDDCLLWGFVTILALQAQNKTKKPVVSPKVINQYTWAFLETLQQQGVNNYFLGQFDPPTTKELHYLSTLVISEAVDTDSLLDIFDWVITQMNQDIQGRITPKTIASLMIGLLEVKESKIILDPTIGSGDFLRAIKDNNIANYRLLGFEKNQKTAFLASLLSYLYGEENTQITIGSAFHHLKDHQADFDYIVCNPPVYRVPKHQAEYQFRDVLKYRQVASEMSLNTIQLGLEKLAPTGSAAFLVYMGTLFSSSEIKIRQEWVRSGTIKAVISLPPNLLPHTSLRCAILLFNKQTSDHAQVSFVKADDLYKSAGKNKNILTDNTLTVINERLQVSTTTAFSTKIAVEQIIDAGYILQPEYYLPKAIDEVADKIASRWTPLSELAKVIPGTRGIPKTTPEGNEIVIRGEDIREMRAGTALLQKKDLSKLSSRRITTQPNDLLIKRIGDRSATYIVQENQAGIIVNDGVFILRFKQTEPKLIVFIAEFLNSDRGNDHIASFCQNVAVQTLSKTILQKITVPIPQLSMQSLMTEMAHAEQSLSQELKKTQTLKKQLFDGLGYEATENRFDDIRFSLNTLEAALKDKDKISYKVSNQYPYPLAYAYRNLYTDREWSATYDYQMMFGELVLSFMVSIGLGLLTHHSQNHPSDLSSLSHQLAEHLKGGISPGHWKNLLHTICLQLRHIPNCPLASQFTTCWFKGRGKKLSDFSDKTISTFIEKLNAKKHWRGPRGANASKEAANAYRENIDKAMLDIEFFTGWTFFINDKLDYLSKSHQFNCAITLLRGDHPCFEQKHIISNSPLTTEDLYCQVEDQIICLSPFLHSLFNPNTQRIEIFSLDKKNRNGSYIMKSFDSGQSIETDKVITERFNQWFDQFTPQETLEA